MNFSKHTTETNNNKASTIFFFFLALDVLKDDTKNVQVSKAIMCYVLHLNSRKNKANFIRLG